MRTFGTFDPNVAYTERIAAYVVIRSPDGSIASVKGRTAYFLPGGGRECDETPEETVHREVREELGRTIRLTDLIGEAIQYFFASSDNCHYKMHAMFFTAEFTDYEGIGEDTLFWLSLPLQASTFFHDSHAWAAEALQRSD